MGGGGGQSMGQIKPKTGESRGNYLWADKSSIV